MNYAPRKQRGVALVTAVLIVALATILAVDVAFQGYMDQRRSATLFVIDQAFEIGLGAEALAAGVLRDDAKDSKTDYLGESWSTPIQLPIDGGELQGQMEDLQGRFNLNNLLNADGTRNKEALTQFKRLLELLQMEEKWANIIADWIDADTTPDYPGAEDDVYTAQTPAYLAANMPITRTSELLALAEFGLENYQRLEPFVTALPIGAKINICDAPAEVLDSTAKDQTLFTNDPERLERSRKSECFPNQQELDASFGTDSQYMQLKDSLAETSHYFRARIWVTIGTTEFSLYSLIYRGDNGQVRTVLRSFGTP